ncbi:cell division transport system permease protein [Kineosphaera limosa]|uniref:Cell division protein FtsX n=1 Tax=Kineosphaera limosa NBRC 100340 TaxID=1184609 RepID=K6WD27_9MICO|nr:permease-like cell division protein FtsX [Kineosphaera limosa]NYE02619.1 cell division transport system permease protein [Kineosphaera limosa]GAB97185.1 cell division protein FtsX [Kineosphaera limosa NBRC 100340]
MMRPAFLLAEVGTGLRRSASMATSIIVVTMVSLFFLGIGLLAGRQVEAAKGYWYDRVEVSIFLCTAKSNEPACADGAVTAQQQQDIAALLDDMAPTIAGYEFETQDQAYARFREQFANNPTFAETPKEAIPAAFRVKLANPEDYHVVATAFQTQPGVATVRDIREVLEPLFSALDLLRRAAWALAAVMLLCSVLLVSTAIRQVAWSRRRETSIKRIVGASATAIRLPFIVETLLASAVGVGLSVGSLWALSTYGISALGQRFRDFAWVGTADVWAVSPILAAVALGLTIIASWMAVTRHVRV